MVSTYKRTSGVTENYCIPFHKQTFTACNKIGYQLHGNQTLYTFCLCLFNILYSTLTLHNHYIIAYPIQSNDFHTPYQQAGREHSTETYQNSQADTDQTITPVVTLSGPEEIDP